MNLKRRLPSGLSCLLLLIPILIISGCDDDSPGGGSISTLSVQVTGASRHSGSQVCVIRHDLSGSQALEALAVNEEGVADFGAVDAARVSFTILSYGGGFQDFHLLSYLDVPGGRWIVDLEEHQDSLGMAEFTLRYPPGEYEGLAISSARSISGSDWVPPEGSLQHEMQIYDLNAGRLDAFVQLSGPEGTGYCGELLNQPFGRGDFNHYSVNVTTPTRFWTLHTSRPCEFLVVDGIRGRCFYPYGWIEGAQPGGWQEWQVPVCDFSMDQYDVWAIHMLGGWNRSSFMTRHSGLPSTLDIPTGAITATYNDEAEQYEQITIDGTADYCEAVWHQSSPDGTWGRWWVVADGHEPVIPRPVLPDSLMQAAGMVLEDTRPASISGWDFGDVTNLDGAVQMLFRSEPSGVRPYDRLFVFHTDLGYGPDAAPVRPELPDPYHRRQRSQM